MYTIQYSFEQDGIMPVTLQNIEGGQTLLEIALDNDIRLQHQCGGICSCTTCHLFVIEGKQHLRPMENREEDYLGRVRNAKVESRLGCQSLVLDGKGTISVVIPDQQRYANK